MTFKQLVMIGLIPNGTELVWKRRVQGAVHTAIVVNGTIQTSDGKIHKTPSGAARHLNNGKPVDGWKVWKIESSGLLLDTFRLRDGEGSGE
jgi:Restriction Enzyme Adenine Methylase Associated